MTAVVEVRAPMVVGFFPALSGKALGSDQGTASALDHFYQALADTAECLEPAGVEVRGVLADRIVFRDGRKESELPLVAGSNESVGCYLVAPGREPQIVRAKAGPSSLIILCPAVSSMYFEAPSCCPAGFTCSPEGLTVGE